MTIRYFKKIKNRIGKLERTAAIIPFEEWERTEKAKDILEHVYLAGIIKERKNSKTTISLDELLKAEELTRAKVRCSSGQQSRYKS